MDNVIHKTKKQQNTEKKNEKQTLHPHRTVGGHLTTLP